MIPSFVLSFQDLDQPVRDMNITNQEYQASNKGAEDSKPTLMPQRESSKAQTSGIRDRLEVKMETGDWKYS